MPVFRFYTCDLKIGICSFSIIEHCRISPCNMRCLPAEKNWHKDCNIYRQRQKKGENKCQLMKKDYPVFKML